MVFMLQSAVLVGAALLQITARKLTLKPLSPDTVQQTSGSARQGQDGAYCLYVLRFFTVPKKMFPF